MTNLGYDFGKCKLGDKRLTARAASIGHTIGKIWTSVVNDNASDLKRAYEFFNPKTSFSQLTQPHHNQTARKCSLSRRVSSGRYKYLDYKQIIAKRSGYGPMVKEATGCFYTAPLMPDSELMLYVFLYC